MSWIMIAKKRMTRVTFPSVAKFVLKWFYCSETFNQLILDQLFRVCHYLFYRGFESLCKTNALQVQEAATLYGVNWSISKSRFRKSCM